MVLKYDPMFSYVKHVHYVFNLFPHRNKKKESKKNDISFQIRFTNLGRKWQVLSLYRNKRKGTAGDNSEKIAAVS